MDIGRDVDVLTELVADGEVVVPSGAGLSADSGKQSPTQPADRLVGPGSRHRTDRCCR